MSAVYFYPVTVRTFRILLLDLVVAAAFCIWFIPLNLKEEERIQSTFLPLTRSLLFVYAWCFVCVLVHCRSWECSLCHSVWKCGSSICVEDGDSHWACVLALLSVGGVVLFGVLVGMDWAEKASVMDIHIAVVFAFCEFGGAAHCYYFASFVCFCVSCILLLFPSLLLCCLLFSSATKPPADYCGKGARQ